MSVTFKNAPLVELIAELRWGDTPPPAVQGPQLLMQGMGPEQDQFFMRLGGEVYQHGFQRAERLVPPGFPLFPYQPVYRYRNEATADSSILFQAGSGLFSVHAVPPYRSWETVSGVVKTGIDALLKARTAADRERPFTGASLRYINAFGANLTKDRPIADFIEDVFGFSVKLPAAISKHIGSGNKPKPNLRFSFPLENNSSMAILLADGKVNNIDSIILDMTVTSDGPLTPALDDIMTVFTSDRNVIHQIFLDLTRPIHDLLEPNTDTSNA